jgi:hypothetical protein
LRIAVFKLAHGVWLRLREAASAGLSAALYSVYSGLYSEAVVSSVVSALALVEVGRFREAVEYVQRAAKALYEAAREAFEKVKVTIQRLVELFVEAVAKVLAWVDEHRAYLFLMAAVAAGVIALSTALNIWGLIELEKLAYAVSAVPFVAGLAETGGKAAERFRVVAERYERRRVDEGLIDGVLKASLRGERSYKAFLKLAESANLPKPLAELRKALKRAEDMAKIDEVEKDAAVVAAFVLYKALVNNAGAYREWAELYKWARGLVEKQEFAVTAGDIKRLREAQKRLEEVAEEVRRELNAVLALYKSHSRDLYEKLKQHLEVDLGEAEELAEARHNELSKYSDAGMGTKAYAALLSIARGGIYGHAAMLLMAEGALADVVLLTPRNTYDKAKDIAKKRGEAVDPSYSGRRGRSVGQPSWEDRAASALLRFLIGYGEADLKFRRVEKEDKKGFQVFRTFGGVEAPVGELWIGRVAYFNVSKEWLSHVVEEAKRAAPDLSGLDKAPQYLEWRATDVSTSRGQIAASTARPWQLRWYFSLLGEPKSFSGRGDVTKEGIKSNIITYWPREREDQILRESRWLKSLLGRRVESWRELIDAIDWSWVLERVEELTDGLKSWIGPEGMSDAEREELVRRMLGELALLVHFAEARGGKSDDEWREERIKRLVRAVEVMSGEKIRDEHADRLARLIIYYAEGYKKKAEKRIKSLAREIGISWEEVRGIVDFVLSNMYCLVRDCARDEVVRKFVAPALELIMLDKALRSEFDREEALRIFGEMYATALAGDGSVRRRKVNLIVGGELGGGAALLRLAALHLLNKLLPDELKFNARIYVERGRYYNITATSENAAKFMRLLAVSAPSAGGEYLSPKFNKFVEEARVEVRVDNIRLTESNYAAADLIISEGGVVVKYNVYLRNEIELRFVSTSQSRAELAASLLRLAGVSAGVSKVGDRDEWYVIATTDMLVAGRKELRDILAEFVERARDNGWVDADKAERWLKKLKRGLTLKEGWPRYKVRLVEGALVVIFSSTSPASIEREAQRLREMGLEEGKHFTVEMPGEGRDGYVYIRREGLAYAAWLSVHGKDEQQRRLAAEFVEYILERAEEEGDDVYRKAEEIVKEGRSRGSLTLKGFVKEVEVDGRRHVVKVIDGDVELEKSESGKLLLRIRITAEVDGVKSEYTITYSRHGKDNAAVGRAYAKANAPGGREADAERLSALIKAITGKEPRVYRMKDGKIMIECGREHLEGFKSYTELVDDIMKWLEETSR